MLYRDVAQLIAITTTEDRDGYDVETETRTEVFVDVQSVKREEFYKSLRAGVELTAAFLVQVCDYDGQQRLEYAGKQYTIVRAYSSDGETLELNCTERKGGSA